MDPYRFLALSAALVTAGCGFVDPGAEREFKAALQSGTSVTVFPAAIHTGRTVAFDTRAAAELSRVLTERGRTTVQRADSGVAVPLGWKRNEAKMAQASAETFSRHVMAHSLAADYALLPEYLIGRHGQVGGVHAYVVRNDGVIAAALVLNSHNRIFQQHKPATATDCTAVLTDAIAEYWMDSGERSAR